MLTSNRTPRGEPQGAFRASCHGDLVQSGGSILLPDRGAGSSPHHPFRIASGGYFRTKCALHSQCIRPSAAARPLLTRLPCVARRAKRGSTFHVPRFTIPPSSPSNSAPPVKNPWLYALRSPPYAHPQPERFACKSKCTSTDSALSLTRTPARTLISTLPVMILSKIF